MTPVIPLGMVVYAAVCLLVALVTGAWVLVATGFAPGVALALVAARKA